MAKYLDNNGLLYLWSKMVAKFVAQEAGKTLTSNDLTNTLKTNYDAAYTHSQTAHAPSTAEQNVQSNWNESNSSSDAFILNKPTIPTVSTTSIGTLVSGSTEKASLVDADMVAISDSAASNILKKITYANLKSILKTYFDTLYATSGHNHTGVYQPIDADLTSIAGLAGTSGILKKTAADTWTLDTTTYVVSSIIGQPNGIASLGADGIIPSSQLPSFVDDVVECVSIQIASAVPASGVLGDKYYDFDDKKLYIATGTNTWDSGVAPLKDKIYVDTSNNLSYRWSGTIMVQITSSDMTVITNAEIDVIVNS